MLYYEGIEKPTLNPASAPSLWRVTKGKARDDHALRHGDCSASLTGSDLTEA
jgi:hypothetical protein